MRYGSARCEKCACVPFLSSVFDFLLMTFHQVWRLDTANHKEEMVVADWDDVVMGGEGNGDNKRKRRTGNVEEEGNSDVSSEGMGYRELQGFAKARGLAANRGIELFEKLLLAPVDASAVADGGVRTIWKLPQVLIHFLFLLEMDSTISAPSDSTWALRVFAHLICSGGDERVKDQVKKRRRLQP
jgi:hypothetical protein